MQTLFKIKVKRKVMKWWCKMKIKELIKELNKFNQDNEVLISSDEELNTLFNGFEVAELSDKNNCIVIYGLSGTEE